MVSCVTYHFISMKARAQEWWPSLKFILLICVFGAGSWVEINGIFVELPILVSKSPQQWSLPSYLTVVIQIANIGPLLYLICRKYIKHRSKQSVTETPVIYLILLVGVVASFLLAFTWKETTVVNGNLYSTSLLVLSFFLALVDCTSSVTFLPFMSHFPKEYMTAFYVGEGMSGLIPSLLALAQGVGEQAYECQEMVVTKNVSAVSYNESFSNTSNQLNFTKYVNVTEIIPRYFETKPRFSAKTFFICVSGMMLCSLLSFVVLVRHKRKISTNTSLREKVSNSPRNIPDARQDVALFKFDIQENTRKDSDTIDHSKRSFKELFFILFLNAILNAFSNGVLPALHSYACLPYGNTIYHYTLTFSAITNPLFCFFYSFYGIQSTIAIILGACLYIVSAGYTIGIAAASPCPLWNDTALGGVTVLIVTVFGTGIVSYLKTAISTVMRNHGYKGLLWNGISVQVGSLIGALSIFPLVNTYGIFKQAGVCQQCN